MTDRTDTIADGRHGSENGAKGFGYIAECWHGALAQGQLTDGRLSFIEDINDVID